MRPLRVLGVAVILAAAATPATAAPPRSATVVEARGMAGVIVGRVVALDRNASPQRVTRGPMAGWGAVQGFCFEGTSCSWVVPGGGRVQAEIGTADDELSSLRTTSRRWRTGRGVGVGSARRTVLRKYPTARRQRTCRVSPYGRPLEAYLLRTAQRTTVFELAGARVVAVWVVAFRVPRAPGC